MSIKAQLCSAEECELVEVAERDLDSADVHMHTNELDETFVSVAIEPAQQPAPLQRAHARALTD